MPRRSRYEKPGEIRLEPRLAARLDEKKARLDLHRPLAPAIARRLHEDLRIRLTYHSNAIEGNTLSLRGPRGLFKGALPLAALGCVGILKPKITLGPLTN